MLRAILLAILIYLIPPPITDNLELNKTDFIGGDEPAGN